MDHSGSFLPQYLSTRASSLCLSALLLMTAGLFSVSAGFEISEVQMLIGVASDGSISAVDRYTHSMMRDGLAKGRLVAMGSTALLFIVWLHRSRINSRSFGARRFAFSRKWALLAFVVPVLNLFRPLQVVSEVWRSSDPRTTTNPFDWKLVNLPRFVPLWWWLLIASAAVELMGMTMTQTTVVSLQQLAISRGITAFADMGAAASAVLGFLVVSGISSAQERKWAILAGRQVPLDPTHTSDAIGDPAIAAMF